MTYMVQIGRTVGGQVNIRGTKLKCGNCGNTSDWTGLNITPQTITATCGRCGEQITAANR